MSDLDRRAFKIAGLAALLLAPAMAAAQEAAQAQVATSAVGKTGTRQSADEAPAGTVPTARIASRIQNRVQSRIRNRLDRYYDPRDNAISPFAVAGDRARSAGSPIRR